MAEVGYGSLAIIPSFKGFGAALDKGAAPTLTTAGRKGGDNFATGMRSSVASRAKSIFGPLLAAGALYKAGDFLKDSIGEASDLNESLNAVRVTYARNSKAVQRLGREAATSLGLSNTEFNSLSVRFSAFSKTIAGGNGKRVVTTLDDLTTRASDFASVMNLEVADAADLFQSGLAGETEPLRRYGLDLSAAKVEAYALAQGMAKSADTLTEADKVQARYALLMQQTAQTQGDFANTSDQLANSQRIINARWDDAKAKLGTGLLPVMTDVSGWVLDEGLPAFERFSDWFTTKGVPAISDFIDDARPLAKSVLPAMGDALTITRDVLRDAAPKAKAMIDAFNDMPDWAKTAIVGGGISLGIGKKLGLGKLAGSAAGGLATKALGKTAPIPVYVVNEGFGGAAGAAGGKKGFAKTLLKWGGPALLADVGYEALFDDSFGLTPKHKAAKPGETGYVPGAFGVGLPAPHTRMTNAEKEAMKALGEEVQRTQDKYNNLHHDMTRRIKLAVDNTSVKTAQEEIRRLINLAETANSIDIRMQGARGAHNRKLLGDSYGSGVTVNIGEVKAHDYNDFTRQARARAARAAGDGLR